MEKIYLSSPHMSKQGFELEYIHDAFNKNWIAPLGENVDMFEKEIASMLNVNRALALNSGTAAIHLALKAVGVGKGDIVFVQDLTFSATVNPIIYQDAQPVFIDSAPGSWNMDPEKLREAFKQYQPKAVIVVHLYGLSASISEILDICQKYNVPLIEDAAESLGTIIDGKWTGTYGDIGILSFNGNKIITTSGGGMLLSNNETFVEKARFWATQAREPFKHYEHKDIGYNYRLSNICAGIGRGQLRVLEERVNKKRYIFQKYIDGLCDLPGIEFIKEKDNERSNYWLSALIIHSETVTPTDLINLLEEHSIESRPIWKPMHLQPVFSQFDYIGDGYSVDLYKKGVCLPSDTKMTDEQIELIISLIRNLWDAN